MPEHIKEFEDYQKITISDDTKGRFNSHCVSMSFTLHNVGQGSSIREAVEELLESLDNDCVVLDEMKDYLKSLLEKETK